jgi:hypothetical protein
VTVTAAGGGETCVGTVAAGNCNLTLTATGARALTATYAGDANFNGSASDPEPHTVGQAATTTTISSDTPDPSVIGESPIHRDLPGGTPTGSGL